jgi:hypothetical protein
MAVSGERRPALGGRERESRCPAAISSRKRSHVPATLTGKPTWFPRPRWPPFRYAESKAPHNGSFPGVGGLGTLQCAAPTMLDRAIGGDCSLLNKSQNLQGKAGRRPPERTVTQAWPPRRVHRWPCNHAWPRELMQDQPRRNQNDQDFCHCSCMRGFCGLDGPGPDVRFGRCGCVGRRWQDGHGHHRRQLCRHAPRLDWRRRFGRRERLHFATRTTLDRH